MQKYFTIILMLIFLFANSLQGQSYDLPCDADANPIIFGGGEQTETLNGTIENVTPFVTDNTAPNVQDFGITGADSALFYRLDLDQLTSFLEIEWISGSADDLYVGLIAFDIACPTATEYGETVYDNPDGMELLSGDIQGGDITFELCALDEFDFDNVFLWVASSEGEGATFELEVTQFVRPDNSECDDSPQTLGAGTINHDGELSSGSFSNIHACRTNFAAGADPCALEFNDGASVWFEFQTGDEVGEIDLVLDNPSEVDVKVAVLEDQGGLCESFFLARYGCADEDNDNEIVLENIAVKPNTTYLILFSTDPGDWNDDFEITISACEPPENNIICDAEDVDFDSNPVQTVSFDGNTECAYPFYDDNPDLTAWFDFDCGLNSVERAVFYKLNIDPDATRLTIENISNTFDDPMAVQVIILDGPASACSGLNFQGAVTNAPSEWGNCDFGQGDVLEINLCDIDNADYDHIYLWVASDLDDEGEFTFEAAQEIAPDNDLCEDAIDLGQGSALTSGSQNCETFSNRGACPGDLTSADGCIDNFQDEALVWFEFTTGDNVGEVSITVDHTSNSDLDVAVIRAGAPCADLTAIRDDLGCDNVTSGNVDLENIPVQSNALYYVIVNTPEEDWGDFEICIDVCEAPDNNLICDAEEINFNPNPDLTATESGTTECATPFYDGDDALGSWFDFDCGQNDVERAVFYKLEIDEHASELTISGNINSGNGPLAAQVFIIDDANCSDMNFMGTIESAPADWNSCNFENNDIIVDLCDIDEDAYDRLYLWVASDWDDPVDFSVEVSQEIAPVNNLCDDPSAGDRGATDIGTINHNSQECLIGENLRGACPSEFTFPGFPACFNFFEENPTVWYEFTTGNEVEAVDIEVDHPGVDVNVAIFEPDAPCGTNLTVPGDFDDYCAQANGTVEFEQLRVKPNTTYYVLVSTSQDDWDGPFDICIEACQPPDNFNVCEAEILNFPGSGHDPDAVAVSTSGTTECAYGFYNDPDLTTLIDFDCGDQYQHAVFYKLEVDPDATRLEIEISTGTAGTMAAQVFFWAGNEDCENRDFDIAFFPDFQDCGFSGTTTIEIDFCPLRADPDIDFDEVADQIYLWIATDLDDQGTFDIDVYQEIAPYNDDCDDPGNLGVLAEGEELCLDLETNRGACPILYGGINACLDGFPEEDEAGVWFSFTTGEEVELISVEVNHSNDSEVRIALVELPSGCGQGAIIPGDADEYCIDNTTNGNDSIWNILVQQETEYFILVSTSNDEWGDLEVCVRNCEPPVNDKLCDVISESVPEAIIQPGEEEIDGGVIDRNAELVEGTTNCASNLFLDFDLTYLDLGCGPDLESAVFYKIDLHPDATELTITAEAIDGMNALAMGLFRLLDDCDANDRGFEVETWTDPFGDPLIDCNALSGGEVVFDLCGLDEEDFDEMYLWVASERKDQGDFELEVSQKLGPPNDDCPDAERLVSPGRNNITSDVDEVICLEEIDAPRSNIWACPEDIDPDNIVIDLDWDEQACIIDATEPEFVGVWYEFTTDGEAGRMDLEIVFEDLSTEFRMVIFEVTDGCNDMELFACYEDEEGELSIENLGLIDEDGQPTTYKILIFTEEVNEGDFDLCLNVKPPIECDDEPPFYYNHTEVICGLNSLEDACLTLQDQNLFFPNESWAPYTPCGCCLFHNPAWITFVAGEADELVINVEITDCVGGFGSPGVQIALYELECETEFDETGQSDGLWPSGPDSHISPCNYITQPQVGTVTFQTDAEPGQLYGIVIDGYNGWDCNISVDEVLVGGEPPVLDSDLLEEPEWDNDGFGFEPGDTICAGATDVFFSIGGEGVPGACTYTWTLDDEVIGDVEEATEIFLDFPDPGTYEVCVFATNLCESTDPLCVDVVVAPLDPIFTMDTICMREEYEWEGPPGFGLLGEGVYGPYNEGETSLNLTFQEPGVENAVGCVVDAFLDLHVIGDNYFNPTEREAVICVGDIYHIPEEDHPESVAFGETGVYGLDNDLFITQSGDPGNFYECDSFFILDLAVIAVDVLDFEQTCDDSIFRICTAAPGLIFPDMGVHVVDVDITWEWVRVSDGAVLDSGDNSENNFICAEWNISEFLDPEEEDIEFRINASIDGEPEMGCEFTIPWIVFLSQFLPLTPEIESDDVFCIGDAIPLEISNQQLIDIDYNWSFSQEPDTIIGDPNGPSLEVVFPESGTVEICVYGQNECATSETVCFEIELNEPPVVFAGDDGTSCDDQFTFDQNTGENGFWTTVSSPGGSTATFTDPDSANTTVTVNNPGTYTFRWTEVIPGLDDRCMGTDEITVEFLTPPFPINITYECDSLGQNYIATFEIVGEAEPYTIVQGEGEIDSVFFTSEEVDDLTLMEVIIEDANGCQSEVIELIERCDCPTAVGQLNPSSLNICDPNCFNTLDHYNPDNEVFIPGQDTVVYFLQTTSAFSTDPDDWVEYNDDGVFCIDDLDVDIDETYYVYVTVGEIDSLTGFIDLDLDDIFNCTRISQTKPITWRAQPVAMAFDTTTCGTEAGIIADASVGVGEWTQISGPGTISFADGAGSPMTDITADECGSYVLQWHEQNFVCADSVEIDVNLNCVPEFDEASLFSNCFEDISYELEFDIVSGTPPFEVIEPAIYQGSITGNTFYHEEIPNSGEELDIFLIEDANGCQVEVVIDVNCDCQPDPGVLGDQINLCITEPNVTVGDFVADPEGEPGDVGTYVLHTAPGTEPGDILDVDVNGEFTFNPDTMVCGETYYISYAIGPPDDDGNTNLMDGCTRYSVGQPVVWYCEPTVDAGEDVTVCGTSAAPLNGSSTFGDGQWSGGAGTFLNPDDPTTSYLPDSTEFGGTVTLTYTTLADDGVCPDISDEMTVTVEQPRFADAGPDQIFCEVDDVQLSADSEGVPGMWSGGEGTFDDPTSLTAVYSPDASEQGTVITLTWTTDAGDECPEVTDEMNIEIVDDLTAVPGDDFIACFLSTNLNAELAGNLDGEWTTTDDEVEFADINDPNTEVTVPELGTYCFTWTVSIGNCEDENEVCVTFVDAPVLVDTIFECNDIATEYFVTIIVEGGDPDSYTANGEPFTGDSFETDWITSGESVTVTITDENDCEPLVVPLENECECLTEVGEMDDPDAVTLCEDQSFDFSTFYDATDEFLDPNDIRVYLLHDGDRDNVGSIIEENTSGEFGFQAGMDLEESYWVTVAVGDELGTTNTIDFNDPCLLYSTGVEVIWYEYPDAGIMQPDILTCAVEEVTITASTDEAPHIAYSWSGPGVVSGQDDRTVTVNQVGVYTLEITDTRANCTSTNTIEVEGDFEDPIVSIDTPDPLTCADTEVEVDGSASSAGNFTYEWEGPSVVAGGTTPVATVSEPGTYTLIVTNNDNGCVSEASMNVIEDVDFPEVNLSTDAELDCSTELVNISGAGSSEGPAFAYSWSEVPNTGANIVGATDEINAQADQSGLYVLEVLNTDNQCRSMDTIEVIEITDVVTGAIIETDGINCFGDTDGVIEVVNVVGGTDPYLYSFDGGQNFGTNPVATGLNPGSYTVAIQDDRGCLYDTTLTLIEPELLQVDLGPTVVVELGENATLEAEVNVDEEAIVTWDWNPPVDPTCENCPQQVFMPERETFVQVTVTDTSGCMATAGVNVLVRVTREVYLPNAFSPNQDGINDFFGVYSDPLRIERIVDFKIFNRWGEKVFDREDIPFSTELDETNAWDGTFNGEDMNPDIFVYYIVIEFADGVEETFRGDFMLFR